MAGEFNAHQVPHFAFVPVGALENPGDAGHFLAVVHLRLEAQVHARFRLGQRVDDFKAGALAHVVHGAEVHQHVEPGGIPQPADDFRHGIAGHGQRGTNANGILDYNQYETSVKLPFNATKIPIISASASSSDVKVQVSQPQSVPGAGFVKFDYKGIVKTYKIILTTK